jgi:hypothetical protein
MLVPTPDANSASPSGTSALEALRQEQAHAPNMLGRRSPKRTYQAPCCKPLVATPSRPEITAKVPPRCSPLGDENGVQSPWAAPTCPPSSLKPSQSPTRRTVGRKLLNIILSILLLSRILSMQAFSTLFSPFGCHFYSINSCCSEPATCTTHIGFFVFWSPFLFWLVLFLRS